MRRFCDYMDCARSIYARIASYSVSLLDTGKSSRMACSTISPVRGFKLQADASSCMARSTIHIKNPPTAFILVHIC